MREPNVNAMLERIPYWQLLEWIEYDKTQPIDASRRGDWQAASMCCAFMNGIAIMVRSRKRFRVQDFLLEFGDRKAGPARKQQTWQEQKFIARMFVAMANAKRKR
jgi:hypothetical protein